MISNDSSRNLLSIQMIDNFTSSLVYIWYILKMCDKLNNFQNYYYYYFFLYSQFQSFDASLSLSLSLSLVILSRPNIIFQQTGDSCSTLLFHNGRDASEISEYKARLQQLEPIPSVFVTVGLRCKKGAIPWPDKSQGKQKLLYETKDGNTHIRGCTHARTLNRGAGEPRESGRNATRFRASSRCRLRSKPQCSVSRNDHREMFLRVYCGVLSAVGKDFAKFDRKHASGFVLPSTRSPWYLLIKKKRTCVSCAYDLN